MTPWTEQHRAMEAALDELLAAIGGGADFAGAFRRAHRLAAEHYRAEDEFFAELAARLPGPAAKMTAQHGEALEIAARLEEALADGQTRDALALARRFHAIAQHNVIEEERDVFPLIQA